MKKIVVLIVILLIVGFLGFQFLEKGASTMAQKKPISPDLTVLVSGYGGKDDSGNWTGESSPFLRKMENIEDVSNSFFNCQNVYEGKLYGNRVLMVTTGMAKVNTTACVSQIFQSYGERVSGVIVVGTAGVTPVKGGALDTVGKLRNGENVMVGDVCINFMAVDFDLQYYSSDSAGTNLPRPEFWQFSDNFPGGSIVGSSVLANELSDASLQVSWPDVPEKVAEINNIYHGTSRKPKVWSTKECMEVTSDLYWNDLGADMLARKMVAKKINEQYKTSVTANDVLVAASMEAVPAGLLVEKYNRFSGASIKFAYVRGASNFDQVYLTPDGIPAASFASDQRLTEHSDGTEYAIEVAALPVLKMMELRGITKE
jgi:hypothetical protein